MSWRYTLRRWFGRSGGAPQRDSDPTVLFELPPDPERRTEVMHQPANTSADDAPALPAAPAASHQKVPPEEVPQTKRGDDIDTRIVADGETADADGALHRQAAPTTVMRDAAPPRADAPLAGRSPSAPAPHATTPDAKRGGAVPASSPPPVPSAAAPPAAPNAVDDGEGTVYDHAPRMASSQTKLQPAIDVGSGVVAALIAIDGDLDGQSFSLREGSNRVGRSPEQDVVLPSRWISRIHCRIECRDGRVDLIPISDKKTLVNGDPPGLDPLRDGDQIRLGKITFLLRTEG